MLKAIMRVGLWSRRLYGRGGGPETVIVSFSWEIWDDEVWCETGRFSGLAVVDAIV